MSRAITLSLAVLMLSAVAASAETRLQWKLPDGTKSKTTISTKFHQTLDIAGMEVKTGVEQNIVTDSVAGQRGADGLVKATGAIESLKSKTELPGGVEIAFDSANPPAPQGTQFDFLIDVYKTVAGIKTVTTYDQDNHIVKIEFEGDPLNGLDDSTKAIVEDQLDADYMQEAENSQRGQIPDKPIKKGDSWKRSITVRLGGGQTFTFDRTYTYEGVVEQNGKSLHAIHMKTNAVEYSQDNPNAPAKVTDSKLTVESSDGRILFDNGAGRIAEQKDNMQIKGDLTLDVNGNELPAKLDLTFETNVKVE